MSIVPSQILYLEHGPSRLYAEAIQIVDARHLCWARPTLLIEGLPEGDVSESSRQAAISSAAANPSASSLSLYDLKNCPDLIWPIELFSLAFDVDFFALLIQLKIEPNETAQHKGTQQLNAFIRKFWQAHADVFPPNVPPDVKKQATQQVSSSASHLQVLSS